MPSKDRFEELKTLIEEAAADVPEIGPLEESLKWGQPSFAPKKRNIGSSVRIGARDDGTHSLLFICTSGLVDEFRELYADILPIEGPRAIHIPAGALKNRDALKHCIQLALTMKLRRRKTKA